MTIYYRLSTWNDRDLWKTVPEKFTSENVATFAEEILETLSGYDNDNGYSEYVEFDINNTRMYGYARFESAYVDSSVPMIDFSYGTFDEITSSYGKYAVEKFKYGPGKDWILINT